MFDGPAEASIGAKIHSTAMRTYLLDYGAGNVRSIVNAAAALGHAVELVASAADIARADRLIFPGVGAFGACMQRLHALGYEEPLRRYLASGRPFLVGLPS